jgi:thioesterase domain-containing protein
MDQYVAPYLQALQAHAGSKPCILVGHCFAGLVAFELARQFQEAGGVVEKVILLDTTPATWGPLAVATHHWRRHARRAAKMLAAGHAGQAAARLLSGWWVTLWWLLHEEGRLAWLELNKRLAAGSEPLLTGMRDDRGRFVVFPVLNRIYTNIYRTYVARTADTAGVLVKAQPVREGDKLYRKVDFAFGWRDLFSKGLGIVHARGNHIAMIEVDENLRMLASRINILLDRGSADTAPKDRKKAA